MTEITPALATAFAAVAPRARLSTWLTALQPWMQSWGINTPPRIAACLAQFSEESEGFTVLVEDLDYSAERLCEVWPSRFPSIAVAAPYAHNMQGLANHVYAGRDGNGDEASGDGWRFIGRGLIQITGRANYAAAAKALGRSIDDLPAWLATPAGAAASACWWWAARGCNALADAWELTTLTERVNGGLTGLSARMLLSERALAALHGVQPTQPPMPQSTETTADELMARELQQLGTATA